jgi:hypothetical protein
LSGTVPSSWRNHSRLTRLELHDNHLSGTLPSSLSLMTNLEYAHATSLPSHRPRLACAHPTLSHRRHCATLKQPSLTPRATAAYHRLRRYVSLQGSPLTYLLTYLLICLTCLRRYVSLQGNPLTYLLTYLLICLTCLRRYVSLQGNPLHGTFPTEWGGTIR